ncbi:MAG TPA: efflux RND transporter periplasmic adaptor subunit [Steroidobacteraceae bacterium]|nr:efflux RND transporter periplasmic adaptor subunit [Steroidobacteraceae bacterium]
MHARVLLLALAASLLVGCSRSADPKPDTSPGADGVSLTQEQRTHVNLYKVTPLRYQRTVDASGVVDFDNDQSTSVLAPFSGPVSRLLVPLGAEVTEGEPLAVVESPDFATAMSTYRKAIATARTARRLADLDKDLIQHNGVSQREEDQAQSDATSAEADRDAALRQLVSLHVPTRTITEIQEGRPVSEPGALIRSPISGTLVERLISPGELLQAGTTACFTVADLSRVWVMAQLFGADLASVSVGDAADIVTGVGANNFSGRVDNISALVDPDTRAVQVRVVADNRARFLKKQMYVRVLIHDHQESTGLLIPAAAVLHDDENLPFVYVAQSDGSFARRHVTLGYRAADKYDVSAGLRAGEQIVVSGGLFLQFMQSQ